jgi:hypothetical protein
VEWSFRQAHFQLPPHIIEHVLLPQPAASDAAVELGRAGSTSYQSGFAADQVRRNYRSNVVRDDRIEELEAGVIAMGVVYAAGWLALIAWAAI